MILRLLCWSGRASCFNCLHNHCYEPPLLRSCATHPLLATQPPPRPIFSKKAGFCGKFRFYLWQSFSCEEQKFVRFRVQRQKSHLGKHYPIRGGPSNYRLLWLAPMNSALSEGMKGRRRRYGDKGPLGRVHSGSPLLDLGLLYQLEQYFHHISNICPLNPSLSIL